MKKVGLDYISVSSGGILPKTNMIQKEAFRSEISHKIKKESKLLTTTSGMITKYEVAENLIKSKKNDDPKISYTALLHQKGLSEILNKISEEAEETITAAQSEGNDDLVHEIADLWFHCLVLLSQKNLTGLCQRPGPIPIRILPGIFRT